MVISGYVTKMAVTPLDLPYPKTPRHMQASWINALLKHIYGLSKFYTAGIGIFVFLAHETLTLT